jgi:ThiS family.
LKIKITDGMGNDKEIEVESEEISGKDLLERLEISVFEATIIKNSTIVRESEVLTANDEIKILKMIHGG